MPLCLLSLVYCSLAKERPWVEHLTGLPKSGWVLFWVLLHLTTKGRPCHVYSDSIPSKHIIGQIIMYDGTTSGFEVESCQHTTLRTAPCHREHGVASILATSVYTMVPCTNFQWSITWGFLPKIWIAIEPVLLKLHATLAPGWALIRFIPISSNPNSSNKINMSHFV